MLSNLTLEWKEGLDFVNAENPESPWPSLISCCRY